MKRLPRLATVAALALAFAAVPAAAWTPEHTRTIGREAARLAPPDLYRQLVRNRGSFDVGLLDPFSRGAAEARFARPDGSGALDEAIRSSVARAIRAIESHRPFSEIAYYCGVAAHYVALAHDPLATGGGDAEARRYAQDFRRYAASAEPRIRRVFYGFRPLRSPEDLDRLIADAFRRSRQLYPMVGREYRRIGFASGVGRFDDRSTAYAVAALSFSHAISDIAEVLRYIWLRAGGMDSRQSLPQRGERLVFMSRGTDERATAGPRTPAARGTRRSPN